jgi:hypothetical protein
MIGVDAVVWFEQKNWPLTAASKQFAILFMFLHHKAFLGW